MQDQKDEGCHLSSGVGSGGGDVVTATVGGGVGVVDVAIVVVGDVADDVDALADDRATCYSNGMMTLFCSCANSLSSDEQ
ncbi:Hypothetical predicted protein, partial [Octopus vulgaris]